MAKRYASMSLTAEKSPHVATWRVIRLAVANKRIANRQTLWRHCATIRWNWCTRDSSSVPLSVYILRSYTFTA